MNTVLQVQVSPEALRQMMLDALHEFHESKPQQAPTETTPATDEFLSREETADLLGVSLPTLRSYEVRGILKPLRYGRRVRYSRSSVMQAGNS